jgi:hypothetical protein
MMKIIIGILFIGLLLSDRGGAYQPSFTTLSNFDSGMLLNLIDDAIDYCVKNVESLSAYYHDFMSSSKIVYFIKYYLPPDQRPGTIVLLGCGFVFVGVWGYGWKRMKK